MGRHPFRLLCLLCTTLCALLLLAFLLLPVARVPGPAGAGGVPQGASLPPTPGARGVIYGGRGPGGNCSNPVGGGSLAAIIQQDFHWGSARLDPRYQHDTLDRLCNDWWAWFDPVGQDVAVRQVLRTLHWPADLFAQPWLDGQVHVSWMPIAFPNTPVPLCPGDQNCGAPNENPACYWTPQVGPFQPTFNLCAPVRAAINAVANALGQGYRDSATQVAFLWRTPLLPFQDDATSGLLSLWNLSWRLVLLAIAAVIAWGALRSMVGSVVNWLSYAQIIELLPRLLFALLAALLSRQIFVLLIQANNALSAIFSSTLFQSIVAHPNPGIRLGLLQILYGLLGFALIVEGAARLALIEALFAASPLLFFLAALPETQRWAQASAVAAVLLIFLQAVQAFLLDVGDHVLLGILHTNSTSPDVVQLLVALAILYLTLTAFLALLRAAFGPGGYALAGFPLFTMATLRRAGRGVRSNLITIGGRAAAGPGREPSAGGRPGFSGARALARGRAWQGGPAARSNGARAGSLPAPAAGRGPGQRRGRATNAPAAERGRRTAVAPGMARHASVPPSPAVPRRPPPPPPRPAAPLRAPGRPPASPLPASGAGPLAPETRETRETPETPQQGQAEDRE